MTERWARLEALGASVADRLTETRRGWFAEFVAVNEGGLALEMLADWMSEDDRPITAAERQEFEALAQGSERILGPLKGCPTAD